MPRFGIVIFLLLFVPSFALAGRGYYGPPPPAYGYDRPYGPPRHYQKSHHDHRDAWIPVAIVGSLLGIFALSQMDSVYTRQAPPERLCRDTYDHFDSFGQYTHSTYVDRPCR